MFCVAFKNEIFKQAIAYLTLFSVLLFTSLPAPSYADLCLSTNEDLETRTKMAYVVAGLTVIGLAAGIACLATASGHHKHNTRSSGMGSVDNYRPYSYSSGSSSYSDYSEYSYSDSRDHHSSRSYSSGYYSTNPDSVFSENDVSSSGDGSNSNQIDRQRIRGKTFRAPYLHGVCTEESSLSGHFLAHPSDFQGSCTAFVQLPDGTSRSLGTLSSSGNHTLSYGPFDQKGTYTFGMSLDQGNESPAQLKLGSIQIEVNGSTVQRQDFMAPSRAPAGYEPSPCCFEL